MAEKNNYHDKTRGGGDDKGRKEKLHHLFDGIGKFGGGNVAL